MKANITYFICYFFVYVCFWGREHSLLCLSLLSLGPLFYFMFIFWAFFLLVIRAYWSMVADSTIDSVVYSFHHKFLLTVFFPFEISYMPPVLAFIVFQANWSQIMNRTLLIVLDVQTFFILRIQYFQLAIYYFSGNIILWFYVYMIINDANKRVAHLISLFVNSKFNISDNIYFSVPPRAL
jgi:hypothetical protein